MRKIAAVVIGLFVVGLSYLSYKGWIDVIWIEMENTTKATLTNVAGQAVHVKIAAIIIGLFVAALAYLSYKGLLGMKWAAMQI